MPEMIFIIYSITTCFKLVIVSYTVIQGSIGTVVPVFSGLCDQRTPAMSGQYNDVRGDFLYKLPRDQRTPANADRHFVVIFAPQPADSALFIYFC